MIYENDHNDISYNFNIKNKQTSKKYFFQVAESVYFKV